MLILRQKFFLILYHPLENSTTCTSIACKELVYISNHTHPNLWLSLAPHFIHHPHSMLGTVPPSTSLSGFNHKTSRILSAAVWPKKQEAVMDRAWEREYFMRPLLYSSRVLLMYGGLWCPLLPPLTLHSSTGCKRNFIPNLNCLSQQVSLVLTRKLAGSRAQQFG